MRLDEAVELIRPAISAPGGTWADLGAGAGLFTRALAELLGPAASIVAVDRDARALAALRRAADQPGVPGVPGAAIHTVVGDFLELDSLPGLAGARLEGALFANALHFAPRADRVLASVSARLVGAGRVVVVEYADRPASRWVPYPLSVDRLASLAPGASLGAPRVVGERASAFGGVMYCAVLERLG